MDEIDTIFYEIDEITEKIIRFLENNENIKDDMKEMWISDTKMFYLGFNELFSTLKNFENIDNIKDSLKSQISYCNGLFKRILSELEALENKNSTILIEQLKKIVNKCQKLVNQKINELNYEKKLEIPKNIILKISEQEYQFPCSICGKIAAKFKFGYGLFNKSSKNEILYCGITSNIPFNASLKEKLISLLIKKDLRGIHNFMRKNVKEDGMDCYCPECDKIYCRWHYNVEEFYDEGFYDYTIGICPKGHKRIIDD
ncbi:MAG: hypothetical protein ACP6IY_09100 [Promethearchaeia archaeon]